MKKRFAIKVLSLLLCFCILVPLLASCASKETSATTDNRAFSLEGTYVMGDTNPVLTVRLGSTRLAESFQKDMITLTGLFEGLEISEASVRDGTITITTSGKIPHSIPMVAGVKLAKTATAANLELEVNCNVLCRSAHIVQESFTLSNGELRFKAVLVNETTTLAVNDQITKDGITYTVKAVSNDKTEITFGVATTQTTLDKAIDTVDGKTMTLPADKTASGNDLQILIYANKASIGAYIDFVQKTDVENTYKAEIDLFVKNGTWTGDVTAADITLSGYFEGATITSVTKSGEFYEVGLQFVKEGVDLANLSIVAAVEVATSKARNAWGTEIEVGATELSTVNPSHRGSTWQSIMDFVARNKGTFETIGTVGSTIGSVAGAASGIYTVLGMVGIIESVSAKLDKIKSQLQEVTNSIAIIDKKLSKIESTVSKGTSETMNAVQYSTYILASGNWNHFISSYVQPLQNKLTDFGNAYKEFMMNYISKAHTADGAVNVYVDKDGKVTLPHPMNSEFSIDGIKISSVTKCRVSDKLESVQNKIMANRGRLYDGYWEDVQAAVVDLVTTEGEIPAITKESYLEAVQLAATEFAMNKVGAESILNAYTGFTNALVGYGSTATLKPLDNYFIMLSMYYNFYAEAKEDISTTLAWLGSILIESSGIATIAYEYSPYVEEGLVNDAYNRAADLIQESSKEKDDCYSFVTNKVVSSAKLKANLTRVWYPGDVKHIQYGIYNAFTDEYMHGSVFAPDNHVGDTQMVTMIKRFENLKRLDIITAESFPAHLAALNIIPEHYVYSSNGMPVQPIKFLTDDVTVKKLPFDKSVKLNVWYTINSSRKVGQTVKYGEHGKQSDYEIAEQVLGNIVNTDGSSYHDERLFASAVYYTESSFKRWLEDFVGIPIEPREVWMGSYETDFNIVLLTLH